MMIKDAVTEYLKHLKTIGRAYYTIKGVRSALADFKRFLETEKVYSIEELSGEIMEEYQEELAFRLSNRGRLLSLGTQSQILSWVMGFTLFLKEKDYLLHDPGKRIKRPRTPKRLPRTILNNDEVKKLLQAPDTHTNDGYRNRIVLEILYDTGIRRSELAGIKLQELDLDAGYITVHGKGSKDRVVPICDRVCSLVKNYIIGIRPNLLKGDKDDGYLLLNRWGHRMEPNAVWAIVKQSVERARLKRNISTHSLRHTCATHMLRNGAPVRHLQEMLGHESLESTQVYTHVTINDLKEVHKKYHPLETMKDSSQPPR